MKNLDLVILPAAFAGPTTALRPFVIVIVFGVREESLFRTEDQIWRYILVNDTGCTVITYYYVTESVKGLENVN
jgi:hypothetical protein